MRISRSIMFSGLPLVVATVIVGFGSLAQAQDWGLVAPHQHSPARISRMVENGTAESTNWSGYAVTGTNITSVVGSWVIPVSTCTTGSSAQYSSFWVGIDGWNSNSVEQTGTDSDCSNGKPSYYAWYEFYPNPSYLAPIRVNAGDVMEASVTYNTNSGAFTATILDKYNGQSYSTTFTPSKRTGTPSRSSAEWIAEAPANSRGVLPLADFGNVFFGHSATGIVGSNYATVNGVSGPIGSFGSNVWSSTMINETTNAPMAVPTALYDDAPGTSYPTSFYVTWYSVGP